MARRPPSSKRNSSVKARIMSRPRPEGRSGSGSSSSRRSVSATSKPSPWSLKTQRARRPSKLAWTSTGRRKYAGSEQRAASTSAKAESPSSLSLEEMPRLPWMIELVSASFRASMTFVARRGWTAPHWAARAIR
jgi:hypothetical protein